MFSFLSVLLGVLKMEAKSGVSSTLRSTEVGENGKGTSSGTVVSPSTLSSGRQEASVPVELLFGPLGDPW